MLAKKENNILNKSWRCFGLYLFQPPYICHWVYTLGDT